MTVLENDTGTHIDSPLGSFATLCGEAVWPASATDKPVTCPRCAAIYSHCRPYGKAKIEFDIRLKAEKPKRKSRKPV